MSLEGWLTFSNVVAWVIGPLTGTLLVAAGMFGNHYFTKKINARDAAKSKAEVNNQHQTINGDQYNINGDPTIIHNNAPVATHPGSGNLKQRTIDLSNNILNDLYRHGWKEEIRPKIKGDPDAYYSEHMPNSPDGKKDWGNHRARYFMFKFSRPVIEVRNEFSDLHLVNNQLDGCLTSMGFTKNNDGKMIYANGSELFLETGIAPMLIDQAAEELLNLAKKIK